MTDPSAPDLRQRVLASHAAGRPDEAERLCHELLRAGGRTESSLRLLAALRQQRGHADDARALVDEAIANGTAVAATWLFRANLAAATGDVDAAAADVDRALALDPAFPEAYVMRGVYRHRAGRVAEALADYDCALALRPDFAGALVNRGAALKDLRRFADALAAYDALLAREPAHPEGLTNRSAALRELGRYEEALASAARATAVAPHFHEAWHNRGAALVCLHRQGEALECFTRAIAQAPGFAPSWQDRGAVFGWLHRPADALADYRRAHALDPGLPFVGGNVVHAQLQCAAWAGLGDTMATVAARVRAGEPACEPLTLVAFGESAADQRTCARTWALRHAPATDAAPPRFTFPPHDRLRVAYLSADFHEHATAYLMAEVFERHDRTRFDVTAVSWGPPQASPMRARLEAAFDTFFDASARPDAEVAHWLRERGIDVAVDLKGHTFDARPGILAHRAAPVQVAHLGFPGTLGAPWIDWLVADPTVVPPEAADAYDERIAWLPECYQPNDRARRIAPDTPPRTAHGLPEAGFVFASFNNTYKILPQVFDVWMRLLRTVEGSCLWLLAGNAAAPANLRREAEVRGVDGARLVFAPRQALPAHLARHRHADLFLDTLPCNAHTTASDALWAGLPVLTCLGTTFAGRVGGSLVRAAGLPELATSSLAEYEATALRLAREPAELRALRGRLAAGRDTCALFDSARYTRHLEAAYTTMVRVVRDGGTPRSFAVAAEP